MSKEDISKEQETSQTEQQSTENSAGQEQDNLNEELEQEANSTSEDSTDDSSDIDELGKLKNEVGEIKDKYLRLYSDFENYRRRTAKEKIELTKTANESLMSSLLPVLDDFIRAKKAAEEKPEDAKSIKEGFDLIHSKLANILQSKGLKEMEDAQGKAFDTEIQEAITQFPAPSEDMKGKIIEVVEKGYFLDEKVIRFAKVVVGS